MNEKELIVAIELGSSAIRGIAGYQKNDGTMQPLRIVQEPSAGCIRRGVVYNIDKTTSAIRKIREKLEEDLNLRITSAYVGIQGQSLRTQKNFVCSTFETEREVTDADIDALLEKNNEHLYADHDILEVIPQEYKLDNNTEEDPKGIQTRMIEGHYNNVVARCKLRSNIEQCMANAGLHLMQIIITPLALAEQVLSESDRRSGCALIDFGAQTTTVQVYRGGRLRHLATIPIGGASITQDIATYKDLEENEAEELKKANGIALIDTTQEETKKEVPLSGNRTLKISELQDITDARTEEILRNVNQCIIQSEISEQHLTSGLYFTGGAAQMVDLVKAYTHHSPSFNKIHMVRARISNEELVSCGRGLVGGCYDSLYSLLCKGEEICTQELEKEPEPEIEEPDLFTAAEQAQAAAAESATANDEKDEDEDEGDKPKKKGTSVGHTLKTFFSRLTKGIEASLTESE